MDSNVALVETLALAVPMWIDQLQRYREATRTEVGLAWARAGADEVACHGDTLQFGGKPGEAARVFNAMARGLAALAHQPGGGTFMGLHWCIEHRAGKRTDKPWELGCPETHGWDESDLPRMPAWQPFGGRPVVTVELPGVVSADGR